MEKRRIVVTGLGALCPIGNTVNEFWQNLLQGVSGAGPITHFDASKYKTRFACEVKNFDPKIVLDRKEVRKHDLYSLFAMVCANEAVEDSGLDLDAINQDRAGVIWGSGIGGITTFTEQLREHFSGDGTPKFNPFFIPKMISNIVAGHLSIRYGFKGPNYATVSACASSVHAILDALTYIRLGKADMFIAGGSEAVINEPGLAGFNALHAISTRNDDPKTASRPFDADRDGFVMAEGGAALILESLESAQKRGAKIYAEVVGGGMTADAHHITAPHPEGEGAAKVMEAALEDSGLKPEDIDYINLHGTSTGLGDIAEPKAVKKVFGEHAYKLSMSATKSMTGHLLGAAGAIESVATVLALQNNIVPPTINLHNLDENVDSKLDFTFHKPVEKKLTYGLNNSFGFGGQNASVIFKKFEE